MFVTAGILWTVLVVVLVVVLILALLSFIRARY